MTHFKMSLPEFSLHLHLILLLYELGLQSLSSTMDLLHGLLVLGEEVVWDLLDGLGDSEIGAMRMLGGRLENRLWKGLRIRF